MMHGTTNIKLLLPLDCKWRNVVLRKEHKTPVSLERQVVLLQSYLFPLNTCSVTLTPVMFQAVCKLPVHVGAVRTWSDCVTLFTVLSTEDVRHPACSSFSWSLCVSCQRFLLGKTASVGCSGLVGTPEESSATPSAADWRLGDVTEITKLSQRETLHCTTYKQSHGYKTSAWCVV